MRVIDAVAEYLRFKIEHAHGRCVFIRPIEVREFEDRRLPYTTNKDYVYPNQLSEIAYVLRVLSLYGVKIMPVSEDAGVVYVVCRDSPLWSDPGLVGKYVAQFEAKESGRGGCFVQFQVDGPHIFMTTNISDNRMYNKIVNAITGMLDGDGLDLNELAKAVNGRVDGDKIYVDCVKRVIYRTFVTNTTRMSQLRSKILACIAMGHETIRDIISCVYDMPYELVSRPDRHKIYTAVYRIVELGLAECNKTDTIRCKLTGKYRPFIQQMANGSRTH